MKVKSESEVTQSCPTLSDLMDCSLPGSSVHGIFQARVLEWGTTAFSTEEDKKKVYEKILEKIIVKNFPKMEKEMAPHSSILAWRIPGMGEPGGLPSMGSHRVGHD